MQARLTATKLRSNLFVTLDQVVATGEAVEVKRPGGSVRIVPVGSDRLAALKKHPGTIVGDADTLPAVSWEQEWQPTL